MQPPEPVDPRPIVSPFSLEGISYTTASVVLRALEKDESELVSMFPTLADLEMRLPAFAAHRMKKLQTPRPLIVEVDSHPDPPPRPVKVRMQKPLQLRSLANIVTGRVSPMPRANTPAVKQEAKPEPDAASSPAVGRLYRNRINPGLRIER